MFVVIVVVVDMVAIAVVDIDCVVDIVLLLDFFSLLCLFRQRPREGTKS